MRTKATNRSKKSQGALDQLWAVKKTDATAPQCEFWSLLTVTLMVPYIKQKAFQLSESVGKIYRLDHRIAYVTISAIDFWESNSGK